MAINRDWSRFPDSVLFMNLRRFNYQWHKSRELAAMYRKEAMIPGNTESWKKYCLKKWSSYMRDAKENKSIVQSINDEITYRKGLLYGY